MSAFVCSEKHISAIVRWAGVNNVGVYHGNPSTKFTVAGSEQEAVGLLYDENVKSVNYRYKEHDDGVEAVYSASAPSLRPIDVIKAVDCLRYQSCEHLEWEESLANKLLIAIQQKAITLLPGYEAAEWCIN
jgi:hypothetical protein